jgi:membrane protein insertase Oxa1/YidC/SpoIIIJ
MEQPSKFTPVIISSAVIIVISLFPFLNFINLLCCAGVIIGGAAGTVYYNNQLKKTGTQIQYKDGVAIGILSGVLSALIVVIGTTIMTILVKQNPIPEIYRMIDMQGVNIPPDVDKFLQQISEEYTRRGFSFTLTIITLVVDLITYPIFSAVGGMLAVQIFGKKKNAAE